MAERMTNEEAGALLFDNYELSNEQALALILADHLKKREDEFDKMVSHETQNELPGVVVDPELVELLREGADVDSGEIALDGMTQCMLLSSQDGAWKQHSV